MNASAADLKIKMCVSSVTYSSTETPAGPTSRTVFQRRIVILERLFIGLTAEHFCICSACMAGTKLPRLSWTPEAAGRHGFIGKPLPIRPVWAKSLPSAFACQHFDDHVIGKTDGFLGNRRLGIVGDG
jgi:hypothetical protein